MSFFFVRPKSEDKSTPKNVCKNNAILEQPNIFFQKREKTTKSTSDIKIHPNLGPKQQKLTTQLLFTTKYYQQYDNFEKPGKCKTLKSLFYHVTPAFLNYFV